VSLIPAFSRGGRRGRTVRLHPRLPHLPRALRRLCLLIVLMAGSPSPASEPVLTLASDSEARWVPFELTPGNQIRFTLVLDGRPVTAMLDTAVSHSAIGRAYAGRAGIATRRGGPAAAIGGSATIGWAPSRSIAFGGLQRDGGMLAVIDLSREATGGDGAVDMLVGADLLRSYALDIDYPARRFRLLRSGRLPFSGTRVPLTIGTPLSFYLTELTIDGRRLRPMAIDTGDGGALTLSGEAWRTLGDPGAPTTSTIGHGLAGVAVSDLMILPALQLGTLELRDTETGIERRGGYSSTIGIAGRIGAGLLRRYRVLLDPGAGQMVLSPGPEAGAPPVRSTSGLLLEARDGALVVAHVMQGGPGAAAGWSIGERICTVDGASPPPGDWAVGTPGRTVTLGLCNGEERRLTLARFY